MVYDVDFATGKVRWSKEVRSGVPAGPKHLKNSYASETPVTDGERVYVYFGSVGLFVFDMKGTPVWSKPLGPFKTRYGWGTAASPVLHRDRIYIVNDNDEQSFLAAYDKRTGAEIWRVNRDEGTNWATPFVWEHDGRAEIVTSGIRQGALVRPDGQAALGAQGDVEHQHPDAVRAPRAAVHLVRLRRRRAAAGVRDPPGRVGRHLAEAGRDEQPVHRLVGADARRRTTRRRSSTATTTTRCSIAASSPATTRGPARRSTAASASRRTRAGSPRRRGRTTARSSR